MVAVVLFCTNAALAIDVDEVRWGFDGRVVPYHFNLLSIAISNPADKEFEGVIRLQKTAAGRKLLGAAIEVPLYLSPNATKWVQFSPYVMTDWETWTISWGKDDDQTSELPAVRFGEAADVFLAAPSDVLSRKNVVKQFPEKLGACFQSQFSVFKPISAGS